LGMKRLIFGVSSFFFQPRVIISFFGGVVSQFFTPLQAWARHHGIRGNKSFNNISFQASCLLYFHVYFRYIFIFPSLSPSDPSPLSEGR
jgi:hypothetical protein